ncbi:MAG TPA: hypothetical protein VFW83_02975 [Bryobacteraceae bacterium]|nr:hypothetical protein [Bryobacteraceae bacterium]
MTQMITELRDERAALDDAIAVLERLAGSRLQKRRGRPPAWMAAVAAAGARSASVEEGGGARSQRALSPATRRKMAESQRKRWEAYRKSQDNGAASES